MRYVLFLMLLLVSPAQAQDTLLDKGRICSAIADSLERLGCFERIFAEAGVSAPQPLGDEGYRLDPFNRGGLNSIAATAYDGGVTIDMHALHALQDVAFVAFKEDASGTEIIAEGTFNVMHPHDWERIVSLDWSRHDRTRFITCASFLNIAANTSHLVVNFLEEQPSTASGQSPLSTASHYAAAISLITDGNLSCDAAVTHEFIAAIPHEDRLPPALKPGEPERVLDERTKKSVYELMPNAILSDDLYYALGIGTQHHLADIAFRMTIEPLSASGDPIRVGSRLAYMPGWSYLRPLEMMGPEVEEQKLPWDAVRFNACATYFEVEERRYLKEQWSIEYSLAEMRASLSPNGGEAIFPDHIEWTVSGSPMAC